MDNIQLTANISVPEHTAELVTRCPGVLISENPNKGES